MLIEYQSLLSGGELGSTATTRRWLPSSSRRGPCFLLVLLAAGLVFGSYEWGVSVGIATASATNFSEVSFNLSICATESDTHFDLELPRDSRVSHLPSPLVLIKHLDDRQCTRRFEGRRLTGSESLGSCEIMSCGSSSAMASSTAPAAPAYAVRPCRAEMREKLTAAKGQLGRRPPKWPVPTESGLWFTSHYASCPKKDARKGDCWWRTQKAGKDPVKSPPQIECDRKQRESKEPANKETKNGMQEGESSTDARNRRDEAHGVTPTEARIQRYKAAGRTRADDEVAYTLKHGFPRASRGDGFGNVAHAFALMQQPHVAGAMWPWELTGSEGTVLPQHTELRVPIVDAVYNWMQPQRPTATPNGRSVEALLSNQAKCGVYMLADTEFVRPGWSPAGSLDHDVDPFAPDVDSPEPTKARDVYSRIYDISLPIVDCRGNVLERWNWRSPDRTPFAATAAGQQILTEAIERLRSYRPEALRICWGNPELVLFTMAGVRPPDRSNGIDVRQALLAVMPWCKPSGRVPFSMSQNLIVPFLGLRLGPLHWAEPDTFDEAVTITALLDGLARFYAKSATTAATTAPALVNPATTATSAAPASDSAGTTNPTSVAATTKPVSTANSAFAAAFQSSASTSAVPAAKKAKTGVAVTSKAADAASSMKLTSFFQPKL